MAGSFANRRPLATSIFRSVQVENGRFAVSLRSRHTIDNRTEIALMVMPQNDLWKDVKPFVVDPGASKAIPILCGEATAVRLRPSVVHISGATPAMLRWQKTPRQVHHAVRAAGQIPRQGKVLRAI